jgi:hypothetical protein
VSPLLTLSCLPRAFLDVLNQQTTNHFPLLTLGSPNQNVLFSQTKLSQGPMQLCPHCCLLCGHDRTQTCSKGHVPILKMGELRSESARARTRKWFADSFTLLPQLRVVLGPCSEPVSLLFQAQMCPTLWGLLSGDRAPYISKYKGSHWPWKAGSWLHLL